MNAAKSIEKNPDMPAGMDYKQLRAEAMQWLETLGSARWTDYNLHDPGITIMEYLCYALTELSYKTHSDIGDILAEKPGEKYLSDSFFPAHQVLSAHPVTLDDYRKVLLDHFHDSIKNVWLSPLPFFKGHGISGQYKVMVQLNTSLYEKSDPEILRQKAAEIEQFLHGYRNLGENFAEVSILQPVWLSPDAAVELESGYQPDKVYADIYLAIDQAMAPDVPFSSIFEMQQEQYPIEEIYEGPLLQNGHIKNEHLKNLDKRVYVSQLLKAVLQVKGVKNIRYFKLHDGEKEYPNIYNLQAGTVPVLLLKLNNPELKRVRLFKSNVEISINSFNVYKELEYGMARHRRIFKFSPGNQVSRIETSAPKNIASYHSIQDDFPLTYGIGPTGLPPQASPLRKAQALQLKSFLLLFEQVMVNYLEQLKHSNELFSFNPKLRHTYYSRPVSEIHNFRKLLRSTHYNPDQEKKKNKLPEEQYRQHLQEIIWQKEDFFERRNKILDHLLARFGEDFDDHLLFKLEAYYNDQHVKRIITELKTAFLSELPELSGNRSKAVNFKAPGGGSNECSVAEKRIRLMLGLKAKADNPLFHFKKHNIHLYYPNQLETRPGAYAERDRQELINLKHVSLENKYQQRRNYWQKPRLNVFQQFSQIDHEFFLEGIKPESYFIKAGQGQEKFELLYYSAARSSFLHIHHYNSWNHALQGMREIVHFFRRMHRSSENISLLEHVQLLPPLTDRIFSASLHDQEGKTLLSNQQLSDYHSLSLSLQSILDDPEGLLIKDLYHGYQLQVKGHEAAALNSSVYLSKAEAGTTREQILELLDKYRTGKFNPFRFELHTPHNQRMNCSFFSSQLTVVLPAISARFCDKEFQAMTTQLVTNIIPAHIYTNFLWLPMNDYEEYQQLQEAWKAEKFAGYGAEQSFRLAAWLEQKIEEYC